MFKLKFFFKHDISKKKFFFNNITSVFLLKNIYKNSIIKTKKIFFNKYIMLKSPFHYKVSKKALYNKQAISTIEIFFKNDFNYIYFEKFPILINNDNFNFFLIKIYNKK